MAGKAATLYTGVTNDLVRRVHEHKHGETPGFTSRYRVTRLVYFEQFDRATDAIDRESQIKGWVRKKKLDLVRSMNPKWNDLSVGWFDREPSS
jgi:putative endonuclease